MDGPTTKWWDDWKERQQKRTGVAIELWDETELRSLLSTEVAEPVRHEFYGPQRAAPARQHPALSPAGHGYRLVPIVPNPQHDHGRSQAPSYLLDSRNEVVPFRHRAEEKLLAEWRDADRCTSALLVWGEGGRGKTRLAHQFALESWSAGWEVYNAVEDGRRRREDLASTLSSRQATRILVIVDYSERWLQGVLDDIVEDISRLARPSTRFLLLARSIVGFWETLISQFDRLIDHFAPPIHLDQFTVGGRDRQEAFDAAVEAFQRAMAMPQHPVRVPRMEKSAVDRSPLALHMAALTAVCSDHDGESPPDSDDRSAYLLRHERRYWQPD
jgi:hypothetical protein